MEISDIRTAESYLSELVRHALSSEEIPIGREGKPLVPVEIPTSPRTGGQWLGQIRIAEDFDNLPPEIAEVFGVMQDIES